MNNLLTLNAAAGRPREALELMQQAGVVDDCMIGRVFTVASDSQRSEFLKTDDGELRALLLLEDRPYDPNEDRQLGLRSIRLDAASGGLSVAGMENPLVRSALLLAGANTWLSGGRLPRDAEDGILTAEDVTGMDLLDTELVVLSACDTAIGDVHPAEGVFGLRLSFVLASARRLVMSLWKVPDEQTQELMTDFYRRILAGQPPAEALRQAQLAIRQKYPGVYYWGAFICQGDPSPVKSGDIVAGRASAGSSRPIGERRALAR